LAFSKDDLLAAGTGGGEIRIWDMGTQRLRTTLKGHTCETESLAFFPDGLTLVSRDLSGGVKFWDMTTHQERLTSDGHTFVSIAPGGEALLLGDRHDGTVRLWRTATDREATRRQGEFEQQADTSRKTLSTKQSSDLNGQSDGAELGKQRADAYGAQVDPTPPPTEPTPKTWQGWHARGHAQLRAQRWDDALDAFAMVIELHKDDNKWHVGDAWHQTAGIHARWAQADKAIEGYTKAIELDPGNHYHWNGRAQVYLRSGELEKALAEFDRALQLDQGNPHIWMGRAQAHLARRQPDEAFADIREAVRRGFDNVAHLRNAPDFAPLRQRAAFQELLKEMEKKAKKQ
jgi:tetratricopeptide (TPR) repeat protein